jgi:hypothetical protein
LAPVVGKLKLVALSCIAGGGGGGAATVSVTVTVTGLPTEGVITAVAVYFPGGSPFGFTVKVRDVLAPAASLPLVGLTASQFTVSWPTCHVNVPPPLFVTVIACVSGVPLDVGKLKLVVLTCIAGDDTVGEGDGEGDGDGDGEGDGCG